MAKLAPGCKRQKITIKGKRGKVVATFMGRKGKACGPRPKPKTGHLRHYKSAMKEIARSCKGKSRGAFLNCMASGLRRT
jgi:hypothetical protein